MLGHTTPITSKTILNSYIICKSCGAKTNTFSISAEYSCDEKAAEAWNRRTDPEIRIEENGIIFSGMTVSSGSEIDADI